MKLPVPGFPFSINLDELFSAVSTVRGCFVFVHGFTDP